MVANKRRGRPPAKKKVIEISLEDALRQELKHFQSESISLQKKIDELQKKLESADLYIQAMKKNQEAAMIVIGYLEGKLYKQQD